MTERPASIPAARRGRDAISAKRKRFGVFYTPGPVAKFLVESTLCQWPKRDELRPLRILDPACGEGALLWPAYQYLCDRLGTTSPVERLQVVRRQLFGVDLDLQSVDRLRQRFRDDLADGVDASRVEEVLQSNIRCGNAVNGRGWEPTSDTNTNQPGDFHWCEQFPEVSAAGGFDVVIANPPYRRERGAKAEMDELALSPLARQHRQSRMDLWHYFFHRSLDLLRSGGMLTFIVNSYWTTSRAGQPLIDRLRAETTPLEFVLLETAPVFAGVGGRHLTLRVRNALTAESCRVVTLTLQQQASVLMPELWDSLLPDTLPSSPTQSLRICEFTRETLFAGKQLNLQRPSASIALHHPGRHHHRRMLGDLFEVRQGIAENPPRVTSKQARMNSDFHAGEGVFVLTRAELAQLELSAAERALVRPYFTAADITQYLTVPQPQQWLLYSTPQTAPDLNAFPRLERHLRRFRALLEQRRETKLGRNAWWHLHWPREERLFERPRILAVQMVQEPRFAFVEPPTYVGFSVNVIVERVTPPNADPAIPTLEALAVILNSQPAARWFDAHAKRRGVNLDITGGTLKEFPIPELAADTLARLVDLGRRRMLLAASDVQVRLIDGEIDELVGDIQ